MADTSWVKVRFRLEQVDGWPPVESEGLWAEDLGESLYRINNTPWFVFDIAAEDVVRAKADAEGVLWAGAKESASGHMTIRVFPQGDGARAEKLRGVLELMKPLGVSGEGVTAYGIVALDVGHGANLPELKRLLVEAESDGKWAYEESCVSDSWLEL